jgi:hypothetical protein
VHARRETVGSGEVGSPVFLRRWRVLTRQHVSGVEQAATYASGLPAVSRFDRLAGSQRIAPMNDEADYVEQFCVDCQDETDQQLTLEESISICLRCGSLNQVQGENERLMALLQRVKDDEAASINRWRKTTVPLPPTVT